MEARDIVLWKIVNACSDCHYPAWKGVLFDPRMPLYYLTCPRCLHGNNIVDLTRITDLGAKYRKVDNNGEEATEKGTQVEKESEEVLRQ